MNQSTAARIKYTGHKQPEHNNITMTLHFGWHRGKQGCQCRGNGRSSPYNFDCIPFNTLVADLQYNVIHNLKGN